MEHAFQRDKEEVNKTRICRTREGKKNHSDGEKKGKENGQRQSDRVSEETEKSKEEMEKIEQILKNDKDEVSEMRNSGQGGGGRSR